MHPQKVKISGLSTDKLTVLTESQNKQYLHHYAATGDKADRDALISGNLRLVLSVVARFSNRGEQADDLFQVGCIGLMKAIDNFNTAFDVRFSTYAVPMIIGEIRRFLRDNTPLRISRSVKDLAFRAMREKEEYLNSHGSEPNCTLLAKKLGVTLSELTRALECTYDTVSLFEPVYSDAGDTLSVGDQLGDTESEADWICTMQLREGLKHLPRREKDILALRFFVGKTQTEVAKEIGISQAQVSRLEKGALERIKKDLS